MPAAAGTDAGKTQHKKMTSNTLEETNKTAEYMPGGIVIGSPDWEKVQEARAAKKRMIDAYPLARCIVFSEEQTGNFVVRSADAPDEPAVASDYRYPFEGAGSRLEKAWLILSEGEPGAWKTIGMLTTLRQALRECDVQMMGLVIPEHGAGEIEILGFLEMARYFDARHHGEATF
jgi:hypothetical protein